MSAPRMTASAQVDTKPASKSSCKNSEHLVDTHAPTTDTAEALRAIGPTLGPLTVSAFNDALGRSSNRPVESPTTGSIIPARAGGDNVTQTHPNIGDIPTEHSGMGTASYKLLDLSLKSLSACPIQGLRDLKAMLSTVDDIILNNELLVVVMHDVVMRSRFGPEDTILFIKKVISHRLPRSAEDLFDENPCVVDLRPLPSRVWDTVVHIIYGMLCNNAPPANADIQDQGTSPWANEALAILSSRGVDDATLASYNLAPVMTPYNCTLPKFIPGAFSGQLCSDIMSHFRTLSPRSLDRPSVFFQQILDSTQEWQQHLHPGFQLRGHHSFADHKAYTEDAASDWATGSLIFVKDVFYSVYRVLSDWSAHHHAYTTDFDSPYSKDLIEALHVVLPLALESQKARASFVKTFLRWVYDAPWGAVNYILNSSDSLASALPWMIFGAAYSDLLWGRDSKLTVFMFGGVYRKKNTKYTTRSANALRVVIFALVHYLEHDIADTTIEHGIFPTIISIVVVRFLGSARGNHERWAKISPHKEEWTAILFLVAQILAKRAKGQAKKARIWIWNSCFYWNLRTLAPRCRSLHTVSKTQ